MDMAQHNIRIIIMAVATAKISVMNAAIPIFNSNLLLSTATAFHLHRTIHFGGVHIAPGDYVYADNNGVIVSKRSLL